MAEINTIPPTAQVQTVATGDQHAGSATEAGVQTRSLSPGTVIAGVIAGKDSLGNYLLRTTLGTFALRSAVPLTYNSDVVARIDQSGGGTTSARIISVNGEPFSTFSAQTLTEAPSDVVSPTLLSHASSDENASPPIFLRGVIVSAPETSPLGNGVPILIRSNETNASSPPPAILPPAQTAEEPPPNVVKLLSPQPATTPPTVTSSFPEEEPPIQLAPPPSVATLNAQYAVYAKQSAITPEPSQTLPQQEPSPPPTLVQAQVVNANENGIVSLQTPLGALTVKIDASTLTHALHLPSTNVTIELPDILPQEPVIQTEPSASGNIFSDVIATLKTIDPSAAHSLLARLPQIGTQFSATSLPFFAHFLSGDIQKMLGSDVVDTLRQNGHADMVEKLSAELQNITQPSAQPLPATIPRWQMLLLPFVYQEELQQARLYVKREPPPKKELRSKKTQDTRFVLEVDLSEMGPLQMDGLVRKQEKAIGFDLIIRTRAVFSHAQQTEIFAIYNEAAEITGFKGNLSFQVTSDFPVKPQSEMLQEHRNLIA